MKNMYLPSNPVHLLNTSLSTPFYLSESCASWMARLKGIIDYLEVHWQAGLDEKVSDSFSSREKTISSLTNVCHPFAYAES
jgi:hypothetical protein